LPLAALPAGLSNSGAPPAAIEFVRAGDSFEELHASPLHFFSHHVFLGFSPPLISWILGFLDSCFSGRAFPGIRPLISFYNAAVRVQHQVCSNRGPGAVQVQIYFHRCGMSILPSFFHLIYLLLANILSFLAMLNDYIFLFMRGVLCSLYCTESTALHHDQT